MPHPLTDVTFPGELEESILSGRCIAFLGSGASAGCYDSWFKLVNELCVRCGSGRRVTASDPAEEFLEAAEQAKLSNPDEYHRYLGEHFGRPVDRTNILYDSVVSLPFRSYITTNFDPLLSFAARHARPPCNSRIMAYPNLDRAEIDKRTLYHVHGFVGEGEVPSPNTIVLAKSEFDEAYAEDSSLVDLIIPTFENDPICFIGCRLQEPTLKRVFSIAKRRQATRLKLHRGPTKPPPRYILMNEPEAHTHTPPPKTIPEMKSEIESFYRDYDVMVVWYPAPNHDHSAIRRAFDRLGKAPQLKVDYGWS